MPFQKLSAFYRPFLPALWLSMAMMALYSATILVSPHLTADLLNQVIGQRRWAELALIVPGLVGLAVFGGAFQYGQSVVGQEFGQKCTFHLRQALYRRLQFHDFAFYDREHTGNLMQRLTGDVEAFRMFLTLGMVDASTFLFNLLFGIIAMATLSVPLTLITLAFMPFLGATVLRFDRRVRPTYTLIRQAMARLQTVVQENIAGVRTVKSFAREEHEIATFDAANDEYRQRQLDAAYQQAHYIPLMQLVGNLGVVALLWYGGQAVIAHRLSLGNLVAFFGLVVFLTGPIQQLGFLVNLYAQASASEHRLMDILDRNDLVTDLPGAQVLEPALARGDVEFRHVSFRHPGQDGGAQALTDVSFSVPAGTVVGLLGKTGSGKSALVNLIPRFYDVSSGEVRVDGRDVREWTLASLRRQIGVVPNETFLFSASVKDNIVYGRTGASMAEVREAARLAEADGFISELPDRYDTLVGERGLGLSGGQRQRVALARALLFDPRILILDDATSSVDMETEFAIQQALRRVMAGRTTFIIAHRLSSLRRAHLILVLDGGRVVERGTHDQLVRQDGLYREIFEVQFRDRPNVGAAVGGE
jgi:ATP-binding cassette subfamily B multidrug efflux pump